MRTLFIGALTATLVGCSGPSPRQAGIHACADGSRFACFVETAAGQPIELRPASFEANPATKRAKSRTAAKAENPSSTHARGRDPLAKKTAKSTMIAAKIEPPASGQPAGDAAASSTTTGANMANSPPKDGSAASSNTRSIQAQVTAATAAAKHATTAVPALEQKANNTDRSDSSKTVLRGNAKTTAPAPPNNTDHLVAILFVRPEIKSVSDLANKSVAIDDWQSAYASSVRTAIVAAGAAEVQMSEGTTLAINRVISGEVPAAVLTLVSPEAAEKWLPKITGFKIFPIPLSPGSAVR